MNARSDNIEMESHGRDAPGNGKPKKLAEWRCYNCGRILNKNYLAPGSIVEQKCSCNAMNIREVVAA